MIVLGSKRNSIDGYKWPVYKHLAITNMP